MPIEVGIVMEMYHPRGPSQRELDLNQGEVMQAVKGNAGHGWQIEGNTRGLKLVVIQPERSIGSTYVDGSGQ